MGLLGEENLSVVVRRGSKLHIDEKELNTKCVVEMAKNQTILNPAGANLGKADSRCLWKTISCTRLYLGVSK
uniref:Uncharacterized protein n=1 Tax=Fundulus heteroclitus TaxID=8078 RepID=A0A3Q2NNU9_FUNHE